jgi:tetratricopeptide (TPR) repeat protein
LLRRLHGPWLLSADGLRDVSERQRTLRGAIGWSYDLLSPVERTLFTRLAVFVGGCTLEAAEMMCEDVLSPAQVLDGIASLLDKSLLHREAGMYGETRYVMLETVREFGLERLAFNGEDESLRSQHASCFLSIVDAADKSEVNPRKPRLNRLIDNDIHNVRSALDWFKQHDSQAALLLITPLLRWYRQRGPYAEARSLLDEVLALPGAAASTVPRANALFEAGILMSHCNEHGKALAFEKESLFLSQGLGFTGGEAAALLGLGRVSWRTGDYEKAWRWLDNALEVFRALGDPGGIAHALVLLGQIALHYQLDIPRARALAEESLAVARQAGFVYLRPAQILADTLFAEGDLVGARSQLEQWLAALRQEQEGKAMIAGCLHDLGIVATRQGDFTSAHQFLEDSMVLWKELGNSDSLRACYLPMAALVQAEGNCGQAVKLFREALAGVKHDRWSWGSYLLGLATLAQAAGEYELIARLLGAIHLVDETVQRLFPIQRNDFSHLADAARVRLGATRFDDAWAAGRELAFDQAAEQAVSILETLLPAQSHITSY